MARRDDVTRAVTFILDAKVAAAAMHAIRADAMEREARVRYFQQEGDQLPEGSHGRENREVIVAHETQIAQGLRAIERAYHAALGHTPAVELSWMFHSGDRVPDRERELG